MNLVYLLLSTLFQTDKKISRLSETKESKPSSLSLYTLDDMDIPTIRNLNREILYEGLISIDSILFLLETEVLKQPNLSLFLQETVLRAKKLLLINPSLFKYYLNFSTVVDLENAALKSILEKRNKLFNLDKSQIALILTKEKILNLKSRIKTDLILIDEEKDTTYLRIVKDLSYARLSDDGLLSNISREKFEFYKENVEFSAESLFESKLNLNLGGAIFNPGLLINLIKGLTIASKRDLVMKSVNAFMEPLKLLKKNIFNKSFMEKKKQIIEFLINCLEIRNSAYRDVIDEAFYYRSILIENYMKDRSTDQKLYKILDKLQEEEIKKLIYTFENIKEDEIGKVIVIDSRVNEKYLNYLCDGQESSKERLMSLLRKNKI